jgi:hypothetical protein
MPTLPTLTPAQYARLPLYELKLNEPEITTLFRLLASNPDQFAQGALLKLRDKIAELIMSPDRGDRLAELLAIGLVP